MLAEVKSEALQRLTSTRSVLRLISTYESRLGPINGDDASRSAKGLIIVQNYAVYEYVVIESVRALVTNINTRNLKFISTRAELLAIALDSEFTSVINGAQSKTWDGRSNLLKKSRSNDSIIINDGLFPKDGSFFRPDQLRTIWSIFGLPGLVVPNNRLLGHIEEMVDSRNRIAHGHDAPSKVGSRFNIQELSKRIDDTEVVCTHIISTVVACAASPTAFI